MTEKIQYTFITDFHKSRDKKIGASDIPMLIPSPNRPIESLAAWTGQDGKRHARTALDLYNEKITPPPHEYNFSADMGHYLEGKAIYEFISDNIDRDIAIEFFRGYQLHKLETDSQKRCVDPGVYNTTPFLHNTEAFNDYGVAHGDCLYVPTRELSLKKTSITNTYNIIKKNGLTIDLSKPFLIEAKSARSHTVRARKHDQYKGYDLTLKTWQGIPLKVYFQCQFQMLLYGVDTCYVVLIFDTSEKHYWEIKKHHQHQSDLIQLATYMKKCIDDKTPPKELLMNSKDIKNLFPETKEDFKEASGDELKELIEISKDFHLARRKEKEWKNIKEDAQERMAIHLKDTGIVKGVINGSMTDIAKWKKTGGSRTIAGFGEISKREDGATIERYLKRKKLIKKSEENKKPNIVIKESELE